MKDGLRRGNVWRVVGWGAAGVLLLLPAIAMQFTDEVDWSIADFLMMGALLALVGSGLELTVRKSGNTAYRFGAAVGIIAAFLLIWVNGAVGLTGPEGDPFDLIYGGVLAVGTIGALLVRFEAAGMMRTLFATAGAQALVVVIALLAGKHQHPATSIGEIVGANAVFVLFWVWSALLFRIAAESRDQPGKA